MCSYFAPRKSRSLVTACLAPAPLKYRAVPSTSTLQSVQGDPPSSVCHCGPRAPSQSKRSFSEACWRHRESVMRYVREPVRRRCAPLYLQRAAGVAARPREPGVTQAVLVQTVPVTSTVVLTGWTDVEVLHRPLRVRVPLIEAEPHRSVDDSRIIKLGPARETQTSVCVRDLTCLRDRPAEGRRLASIRRRGRRRTAATPVRRSEGLRANTGAPGTSRSRRSSPSTEREPVSPQASPARCSRPQSTHNTREVTVVFICAATLQKMLF